MTHRRAAAGAVLLMMMLATTPVAASTSIKGVATYYCWPGHSRCTHGFPADGAYAAAGPELRAALGPHYKGKTVYVNGVRVKLIDWCACGGNHVIDVYHSTWVTIPHPNHVTITMADAGGKLPDTDTLFPPEKVTIGDTEWIIPIWAATVDNRTTHCRSCNETILFVKAHKTGKLSPLERDGVSHFARCPQRDSWRKP